MVVVGTSCSFSMPARTARWSLDETSALKASWSSFVAARCQRMLHAMVKRRNVPEMPDCIFLV